MKLLGSRILSSVERNMNLCLRIVLTADGLNGRTWLGMGNVLKDLEKKEDSIKAYEKFIEVVEKNELSDWDLEVGRVRDYLKTVKP